MLAAREGVMPELRQICVLISPAENVDAVRGRPRVSTGPGGVRPRPGPRVHRRGPRRL